MPRVKVNYNNISFYKISKDDDCYISYTTDITRMKYNLKKCIAEVGNTHNPLYPYIRENGGITEFYFEIIECDSFENIGDVLIRKEELIKSHNATLNFKKRFDVVTYKREYYLKNKKIENITVEKEIELK